MARLELHFQPIAAENQGQRLLELVRFSWLRE